MENVDDIIRFYNSDSDEATRLERHQLEREITFRYLDECLPIAGRILEIGAATGVYSVWLAQRGHHVTAVDVSEKLLTICSREVDNRGLQDRVDCVLADARELPTFEGRRFDAVLVMGPLYHLKLEQDRLAVLREATMRVRLGGICMSSHINRLGVIGHIIRYAPEWIDNEENVISHFERGYGLANEAIRDFRAYHTTVNEIIHLHEKVGLNQIALVATEPLSVDDTYYNSLQGERRERWLDLLKKTGKEPSVVSCSRRLLYVGQRR